MRRISHGYAFVSVGFYPDPTHFNVKEYYAYLLAGVVLPRTKSYGAVILPLCTGESESTCFPSLRSVCSNEYGCTHRTCLFHALNSNSTTLHYIYNCKDSDCKQATIVSNVLRFLHNFSEFIGELAEAGFAGFNADIDTWVYPHLQDPVARPEELEGVLQHYAGLYFPENRHAFRSIVALIRGGRP